MDHGSYSAKYSHRNTYDVLRRTTERPPASDPSAAHREGLLEWVHAVRETHRRARGCLDKGALREPDAVHGERAKVVDDDHVRIEGVHGIAHEVHDAQVLVRRVGHELRVQLRPAHDVARLPAAVLVEALRVLLDKVEVGEHRALAQRVQQKRVRLEHGARRRSRLCLHGERPQPLDSLHSR